MLYIVVLVTRKRVYYTPSFCMLLANVLYCASPERFHCSLMQHNVGAPQYGGVHILYVYIYYLHCALRSGACIGRATRRRVAFGSDVGALCNFQRAGCALLVRAHRCARCCCDVFKHPTLTQEWPRASRARACVPQPATILLCTLHWARTYWVTQRHESVEKEAV